MEMKYQTIKGGNMATDSSDKADFRAPTTSKRLPSAVADGGGGMIIAVADVAGSPERVFRALTTNEVEQWLDGRFIEERTDPRASYPVFNDSARWDAIQVAYFTSAAVWNHLAEPFVFTYPGVQAREIEPWREDGQIWRRLAIKFPASI